jgi:hypothetical protein
LLILTRQDRSSQNKRMMAVTTKADYTVEERDLLMRAPFMASMAIVMPSASGPIDVIEEMLAVERVLAEVGGEGASQELSSALVSDVKAGQHPAPPTQSPQSVEEAKELALKASQEVTVLLARKPPAAERSKPAWEGKRP